MEATGRTRRGGALRAATVALGILAMAGCGGGSGGEPPGTGASASPSATAGSVVASASPSPTSTLTMEEQQAFEEATATALAFEQVITDLYSGTRIQINDLDQYATDPTLDRTRISVSQGLAQGFRSENLGAQLRLVRAEPVSFDLDDDPETLTVRLCIDSSADIRVDSQGEQTARGREQYDYVVVRTDYLPDPAWAVSEVLGEVDPKDRAC